MSRSRKSQDLYWQCPHCQEKFYDKGRSNEDVLSHQRSHFAGCKGKQVHDLPPHCARPGCCVGVLVARCRRCGFIAPVNGACPATEDFK